MVDKKLKILLVEDDLIITHDITALLRKEGFENVISANNPTKAVDKLSRNDIDFAILDINLGAAQNGINIAEIIRRKYKIPFVFLTSYSDKETLELALEQKPNGYLVKPYQEDTLISTMYLAIRNFENENKKINFDNIKVDLTKKEIEILKHICNGKVYHEIAELENVSLNTVRFHVKNIYPKFNVNSSTELIVQLLKQT